MENWLISENPKQLSAATLAFLGDAVYELLVRRSLATTTIPAGKLHKMAIGMVCAPAQSAVYEKLEGILTDEELAVMKRGPKMQLWPIIAGPPGWRRCLATSIFLGARSGWRSCSGMYTIQAPHSRKTFH